MDLNSSSSNAIVQLEEDSNKRIREDTFAVQMSQAEKQQCIAAAEEHTQDGSLDFFGRPAVRHKHGGLKTLPFTLGVQFMINASMYAVVTNLILYLTENLHQPNSKAATDVTNWNGSSLLFSVVGAFLADAYFGRFWTSVGFIVVFFCGSLLGTFTTFLSSLKPLPCSPGSTACLPATGARKEVFYLALYIQGIGFGSFQPCNIAFGADQFDENDDKERRHKSLFFSLVYVASSCGGVIGNTVLIYLEQKVSYTWGFAACTALAGMTILFYFTGIPMFRYQKPEGNPLTRVSQVVVATIRKWNVKCPADESQLYEVCSKGSRSLCHTQHFRFLDRAAFVSEKDVVKEERRNGWRLCTVTQVEEVKFLLRILPIWASSIFYSTLYVQILTMFIEQASTLDLSLGRFQVPAASVSIFETLSVCFWAFAYEKWVVPLTRRFTGNPRGLSLLQRMGTGMIIGTIAIATAAVFEIFRLREIKKHHLATNDGSAVVPITFFWLLPQYFMVGASEAFAFVGQYEFFYDQAPEGIRGVGSALQFTSIALGNFISGLLVSIVSSATASQTNAGGWLSNNLNAGHLDYFYWILVMLGSVNFAVYVFCARSYKYSNASYVESSDSNIAV